MLRVAIAQINSTVGDLSGNEAKVLDYVQQAQGVDADIVVFSEMVITGYPPEDLLYKDHFVSDNLKVLKRIVKKVQGITAIVGFVDRDADKNLYNAAAIIAEGEIKGRYYKEELPNYGVFDEKRYFKSGKNSEIYAHGYHHFAVNICEDIWVSDGIYQKQSQQGASLIINVSSSPYDMNKQNAREKMLKDRAEQTNSFICYANLVGGQDELVFDGGSLMVDPKGRVLARGHRFEEDLVVADLPLGSVRERKYKSFDITKVKESNKKSADRAPIKSTSRKKMNVDESIYRALVLGTGDYVRKNGFEKVLIGLSGGIDSSLVAAVAVDALGAENVVGITMPSNFTSKGTKTDAHKLAENLNITCHEIPIEGMMKSYLDALKPYFKGLPSNIAEENIQARIRGNLLMAMSNKFGWMVLTTGNKSEMAVGYCTLYGDMSGGFAVIKDIPKTKVYELSEFINLEKGVCIPPTVLSRPPSAELRENQKDQDSLPPYDDLDYILEGYVEKHKSMSSLSKKISSDVVKDVIRKVDLSEYKRRQSPIGVKITQRAFGKDWRLPITNKYREA